MSGENKTNDAFVQIKFFTKQQQYAVADIPYSVPSTVDTAALNTLLHQLLKESEVPVKVEFDFIISDELLRTNLIEHLNERNISTELTINVEYIERNPPPEPQDCLLHDDWVSAVDIRGKWILTGCYDNTVHLWSLKGKHKLTIPGHTSAVKSVSWAYLDDDTGIFISGSHDQTAILWQWLVKDNAVKCVTVLRGHERGVESVRVNPNGAVVASSGWDGLVKIWSAKVDPQETDEGEPASKKMKTEFGKVRTPIMTLQGHREAVSGISWMDNDTVVTAGWDHTVRLWDIQLGGLKHDIIGNKAFFDIDYSNLSKLIVTASADRYVRIYDPRSKEGSIVKNTYTSHSQWVHSVRWSDTDEHLFVSGGLDNYVKIWDTRSCKAPLCDLEGHENKVLCCDWRDNIIAYGSADNTLRVYKHNKMKNV